MVKYNVRSRQLIDIVGDVKREKIVLSPYFQRNLVWRQIHKQDFIKTILLGYPFPQIFLAKGGLNVEELTSISLIVDGQQRMNSILEFIENEFAVDGRFYSDLTLPEKDDFFKYEIAIIELQMESDNPEIKEVFQRLNRTFYSLTNIERLSTEYAPSELMLLAKYLTKEIEPKLPKDNIHIDPNVPESFIIWALRKKVTNYNELVLEAGIFTNYEISRKVHLMVTLNILGTIERGFFNRNIALSLLEEYSETFPDKDQIVSRLDAIARKYLDLKLPVGSYWYNKANFFTIITLFYNYFETLVIKSSVSDIKRALIKFEGILPQEYALAAKEAVNNKKERTTRYDFLRRVLIDE